MNNNEYKVNYDKLEEYINRLKCLDEKFPETICQGAVHDDNDNGDFEGLVNKSLDEISVAQKNLKTLISKTYKYLYNFKNSVENYDEVNARAIQNN